jgi:mannan endo-1,4-beta-mannosidase
MIRGLDTKRTLSYRGVLAFAFAGFLCCSVSVAQIPHNDEFVKRDGTRLTLGGETFRFSGPNIEWLGVEGYGPLDSAGPRYPSLFEIDDALDTAKMMGAQVIRSQTLGDSIGCDLCVEPKLGEFNPEAFRHIDYVLKAAHERGLRLIFTLVGDNAYADGGGASEYVKDLGPSGPVGPMGPTTFFTDPRAIVRFEEHIAALLNHKNSLTGIAYKDDPTILAWEDCNACGGGGSMKWVDTIGSFIKSIDKNHLYEDNGIIYFDKSGALFDATTVDIFTAEYYPHWDAMFAAFMGGYKTTAELFSKHAERVTSHGKVYVVNEYGWDNTDWPTQADLEKVLTTIKNDPKISGDLYWALQAHNDKFGWQPIPANVPNKKYSLYGESGQWWALYYGGIDTLVMTKEDMAARAELLRTHAFEMAGRPVPPHAVPSAPVITVKGLDVVAWRGSAGAVRYTVERKDSQSAPWKVICDKCATDGDAPWVDPKPAPGSFASARYRVTAYNADDKASPPSEARPAASAGDSSASTAPATSPSPANETKNLTGQWNVHQSIAGNESDQPCNLVVTANKISGTCKGKEKDLQVTGAIYGNKVTWQFEVENNGSALTLVYTAALGDSEKLAGTVEIQPYGVTGDFMAKPGPASASSQEN